MKNNFYYHSLDSTMKELSRVSKVCTEQDKIMIIAGTQTKGRGRNGNQWHSPPSGLWLSFNLFYPSQVPSFALYIGFCLHQLLTRLFSEVPLTIKWPNDLYFGDCKMAGIICENDKAQERYSIGIGINTNNIKDDKLLEYNIANLSYMLKFNVSNSLLAELILSTITNNAGYLASADKYIAYCNEWLYGESRLAEVSTPGGFKSGRIEKISGEGSLILTDQNGTQHKIDHGTLRFLD